MRSALPPVSAWGSSWPPCWRSETRPTVAPTTSWTSSSCRCSRSCRTWSLTPTGGEGAATASWHRRSRSLPSRRAVTGSGRWNSGSTSGSWNQLIMGRIEEALRRAGAQPPRVSPAGAPENDVFVSAWTLGSGDAQPLDTGRTAALPDEYERHEPPPGLHVVRPSLLERFRPAWRARLIISPDVEPTLAEQFRRLAAT